VALRLALRESSPYYYRATLCALTLLSPGVRLFVRQSVRPSIRPSVTLVHCIHTDEDIVKLLYWPGSHITLVF